MDFFEQNKALIITVLLFLLVILAMYNIHLSGSNKEIRGTLIELENIKEEERVVTEEEQQQQPEEETPPPPENPPMQTHQAFNENQSAAQENFRSRLDEILKKNSAEQELSEEEDEFDISGTFNTGESNKEEPQQESDGEGTSEELSEKIGSLRNSSISFSLLGRQAIEIPNPIYTCESGGKIVINITVNERGLVEDTSFNSASSTSTNKCLIEHALQYAADARFSVLAGRNSQIGTITYNFQEQ